MERFALRKLRPIDHAIEELEGLFSESAPRPAKEGRVLTWQLEWHGTDHSVSAVHRDFHRLLGGFAEETEFVSQFVEADSIRYEVLVGSLRGHQHIHHVRFRIGGQKVAAICSDWRRNRNAMKL